MRERDDVWDEPVTDSHVTRIDGIRERKIARLGDPNAQEPSWFASSTFTLLLFLLLAAFIFWRLKFCGGF